MTRAFRSTGSLAFAALSLGMATAVYAQQDPPGCVVTGVALSVQAFLADGTTPATPPVSPCASLNYLVTIAKSSSGACAFGGGSLSLTTPDGVAHTISANVPCIGGTGVGGDGCAPGLQSITSALIPYTVKPSDIHSGFVTAVALYGVGVAFDGPVPTPGVSASTPRSLAALTTCADTRACTLDLCDAVTGCRHLITPRCFIVGALNLKLATSLGSASFKVQDVTKDGTNAVKVTLQELVLTSLDDKLVKKKVKLGGVVGGADAGIGSLLYPVAALAGGTEALHTQGYDVTFTGTSQACQDTLPADVCTSLAKGLAQAIDAQLTLGDAATQAAFRQGIQALGYRPDAWCVPTTCCALGATCGSFPDGCGGTLDCGTCTPPLSCGGGGVPNQCGIIF